MEEERGILCTNKAELEEILGYSRLELAVAETRFAKSANYLDSLSKLVSIVFYLSSLGREVYNKGDADTDKSCGLCCGPGQNGTSADKPLYFMLRNIYWNKMNLQNKLSYTNEMSKYI